MDKPILLITGGGRGIGAATAKIASQQGYLVVLNYRQDETSVQNVIADIHQLNGQAYSVKADISDANQVDFLFDYILKNWGPISALVNNAGILETQSVFAQTDISRWERVFKTNVFGTFSCCQAAFKHMAFSQGGKGGSIVNVSSLAAISGSPNEYADYASSKAAVDTFSKGFAKEVANDGIRVNVVRPGFIYTDMHKDGGEAGRVDRLAPSIPMQRGGKPEEVAEAILWLLSDKASYASGSFIDVAGGR